MVADSIRIAKKSSVLQLLWPIFHDNQRLTDETGLSKRIQAMKFLMAIKLETFSHKPVLVFLKVS
uniref:Uncharacterized protein n=1 Tax=Physcomitrium patens TaxID=3218 RepID=A0A2K1L9M8_PHYPA|nr:hypothetical protein PHYPA_001162 [Physcomitrium patens]